MHDVSQHDVGARQLAGPRPLPNRVVLEPRVFAVEMRVEQGAIVVDKERVTGMGPEVVFALAIYEVEDGLIRRVWFARPREPEAS